MRRPTSRAATPSGGRSARNTPVKKRGGELVESSVYEAESSSFESSFNSGRRGKSCFSQLRPSSA
jgi:hypothetical protein